MENGKIMNTIKGRTSIRSFVEEEIPWQVLLEMISAGMYAPSGKNRKPWKFIVICDQDLIRKVAKQTTYSRFIRKASVLLLVYIETGDDYELEKDILSTGMCIQNILLAIKDRGYGSCVIGEVFGKEIDLSSILNMDFVGRKILCGIAIGKTSTEAFENGVHREVRDDELLRRIIVVCG